MAEKKLPKGVTLRKDGRYMGRFMYHGQAFTVYGEDPRKVKKELDNMRYEVEHNIYNKPSKLTVDRWFNEWIEVYKIHTVKATTIDNYTKRYNRNIKKILGKKYMVDVRATDLQKILNDMSKNNLSAGNIHAVNVVLNGMFSQAYKNKLISENPVRFITEPKGRPPKKRNALTRDEQELFMRYIKKHCPSIYKYYALSLYTGMRLGEIGALRWDDVDFNNKVIHVRGTLVGWLKGTPAYITEPKTAASIRDIPMIEAAYNLLKLQKKEQLETKIRSGGKWQPINGLENLVFLAKDGQPRATTMISHEKNRVIEIIRRDGYEMSDFPFHSLRHTFATRAIEGGMSPQTLKAILGHTNLSMTMDLYSHVMEDTKKSEMKKISAIF